MDHNERFDQLESLMADMLRRMDQLDGRLDRLEANQERTNTILDSVVDVLKIVDQRFQRVEDVLLKADERQQRVEDTQNATLRLLLQQSENLTAAFRTLEAHDGRIQKLEGPQAA